MRKYTVNNGFIPLLIVLIIAVVGILGAAAYFVIQTQNTPYYPPTKTLKNPVKVASSSATSPAASSTAQLSSWITYTNNELGFSIKHPSDIVIIDESDIHSTFARLEDSHKNFDAITTLGIYKRGDVGVTPEAGLQSECPKMNNKPCQENYAPVRINNAVGIKTLGPNYPNEDNYYLTSSSGKSKLVRVYLSHLSFNKNEDLSKFKEMIQTFKFIN